ncbi:MAG: alpha/beta fold hydrolase [Crocinitomicaceae bacterium]|nr:alpha/beta hydrolase [Flavobacteriales bacterium]NQZ35940.1 alpha/beta fold hydrolase [Crocinitomicaceae bacterium]
MRNQFITLISCLVTFINVAQEDKPAFSFAELKDYQEDTNVLAQQIKSFDGTEINYYQFTPEKPAIAKLVFIHGGGVHSKLGYFHLAQTLRDSFAIETILVDLRGHGLSQGKRGDCPNVRSIYKDLNVIIQAKKDTNLPIYLGGHSSGGGVALNYSRWKKSEKVDGYFFVSPELGYKSDTEREGRIEFAEVKVWKFVINGMTQGLLMQHSDVVFFNYPEKILEENPLILTAITVNMSKALTPKKPVKQFKDITEPIALFVGEHDELFDPAKVIAYASLPTVPNKKTTASILKDQTHLSILNTIGIEIGHTVLKWQAE